jgi:2-hydroxychromene-2-carboxylate isomerase
MKTDMPPQFPILTLPTQRLLTALALGSHSCCVPKAGLALFQAFWVEHKRIDDPAVMYEVLSKPEVLGEANTKEVMEQMGSKAVKDKLSANTQASFDVGSFGLPWFEVEDGNGNTESFWGVDHLGMMAHFLGVDAPVFESWKGLKATL